MERVAALEQVALFKFNYISKFQALSTSLGMDAYNVCGIFLKFGKGRELRSLSHQHCSKSTKFQNFRLCQLCSELTLEVLTTGSQSLSKIPFRFIFFQGLYISLYICAIHVNLNWLIKLWMWHLVCCCEYVESERVDLLCLINLHFLITKCHILYVLYKEKLFVDNWLEPAERVEKVWFYLNTADIGLKRLRTVPVQSQVLRSIITFKSKQVKIETRKTFIVLLK